jgi:hypothetical protein
VKDLEKLEHPEPLEVEHLEQLEHLEQIGLALASLGYTEEVFLMTL